MTLIGACQIAKSLTVGGLELPFRSFMNDPTSSTARIAPQVFGSNRIVFDFPHHAVYLSKPDGDSTLTAMFSDLTDSWAKAQADQVSLEDPDHAGSYLPVQTFAGRSVKDLVKAVESGNDSALKTLSDLYDSYFSGCDIVLLDNGTTKTVHIKNGWPK